MDIAANQMRLFFDSPKIDNLVKSRFWDGKVKSSRSRRAKSRGMQRTSQNGKFRGMQRNTDIGLFTKPSILIVKDFSLPLEMTMRTLLRVTFCKNGAPAQ